MSGQARITHPDPGVADAIVPASAVPHWQGVGWQFAEGDAEEIPAGAQRFEGQSQARIYHPVLDRYEFVPESAVPHWRSRGWMPAEQVEVEAEADEGAALESLTVEELKEVARDQGVPVSGTKAELLERLRSAATEQAGEEPAASSEESEA